MRIRGNLDVTRLHRAIERIAARHEVLCTRYPFDDEDPRSEVDTELRIELPLLDLRALPGPERDRRTREAVAEEAWRPYDLETGPMLRNLLIRVADDEHVAVLGIHHIASDGWSMKVFDQELGSLYTSTDVELPALPIQYGDYAAWQQGRLTNEFVEPALRHLRAVLDGAPRLDLATDRPRPPVFDPSGAVRRFEVPAPSADVLRQLAGRRGVTLYTVLKAAWDVVLAGRCGEQDITVGTPVAGRDRAEVVDLIGCFINTLVLRSTVDPSSTFADLLDDVREKMLAAYEWQDVPFDRLVVGLQADRDPSRHPLFDVMFSLTEETVPSFGGWMSARFRWTCGPRVLT